MHFTYEYVPHCMEKMKDYIDFIFYEVWCKAPGQDYDISLFNGKPELKGIIEDFSFADTVTGDFFVAKIQDIYTLFQILDQDKINRLKNWYEANNDIEALCANQPRKNPVTYDELKSFNNILADKFEAFFKSLYNKQFLDLKAIKSRIGEISEHYLEFVKKNAKGICPYCGLHMTKGEYHTKREAYDHYLPKDVYPFNSINFRNLAPICNECNSSYKLAKDPLRDNTKKRRKSFYSYSTVQPEIKIELDLPNNDIEHLKPSDIDFRISCQNHDEELRTWLDLFSLSERYKAVCLNRDLTKYWIMQVLDELPETGERNTKAALAKLRRQAERLPIADHNFLKLAFLEACDKNHFFDVV